MRESPPSEPVTQHRPVLLEAAIASLHVRPNGVYVDATFGRGGHTRAILAQLSPPAAEARPDEEQGRVIAFDRDPAAVTAARAIRDARLTIVHARFSELGEQLARLQVSAVDGILIDLGVSSPQLDDPERGFSFRADGLLDMRMDPSSADESAAAWLARASEQELGRVIADYGEERFAKRIARAIVAARAAKPIATTRELAGIVARAVATRETHQDPATRTFQAIRIHINRELDELARVLPQALAALKVGARLVVISFHSLEDRLVKRFFQAQVNPTAPRRLPLTAAQLPKPKLVLVGRPQYPSDAETARNPRARSAVMRVAEKLTA